KGRDPFSLQLGQGSVIKGWDLGLMLFPKGSKGKLYLEPEFAYGERGAGGVIPPNASLVFEIEMLEIMDEAAFLEDQRAAWVAYVEERMAVELPGILAFAEAEGLDLARTDSGLHYVIEKIGSGKQAEANKEVSVHYTGRLLNGGKFDSSHDRNRPISFPLGTGKVIQGWDEGIALFKEGGKGKLIIPSYLGYGGRDMGSIPANSTLVFDIELLEVK
ncbi:MAG: FKBP-type peptidyl-prolyl cis-trans isomerase, partial [Bacteroidota bacterium]